MRVSHPPMTAAAKVRRYETRRYHGLDQRIVDHLEWRCVSRFLDRVLATGSVVLDVPCGYGRFAVWLQASGAGPLAADLSFDMVARARERVGAGARYAVADIRALPYPDQAFHGALVMRLLQHMDSETRRQALGEVARVIRDWAIISAYAAAPLHRIVRRVQGRPPKEAPMGELTDQMRHAGLDIVDCRAILPGLHAQRIFLVRPAAASQRR